MPKITIGSTIIDFPNSGRDANWSQGVIEFAQAVEAQLAAVSSPFDIGSRVQILTSDTNTNLDIDGAVFPSDSVRSFNFNYSVYRNNNSISVIETGIVTGIYNTLSSTWVISQSFIGDRQNDGSTYQSFSMSGDQLQLTTTPIGGSYDNINSSISYSAKTELVTS